MPFWAQPLSLGCSLFCRNKPDSCFGLVSHHQWNNGCAGDVFLDAHGRRSEGHGQVHSAGLSKDSRMGRYLGYGASSHRDVLANRQVIDRPPIQ
jgi:hypothetical protein